MSGVTEVQVGARSLDRLTEMVAPDAIRQTIDLLQKQAQELAGRVFWNVNSTARGGGVAEMLRSLVAYARGTGLDARWITIFGDSAFFHITKRLHHAIHGAEGDGSPLGDAQHALYEHILHENAEEVGGLVKPGDVVLLHDPQTAGLIPHLSRRGCVVIWRCHIGHDDFNQEAERGWSFLRPSGGRRFHDAAFG
jgi:trehalose synthase